MRFPEVKLLLGGGSQIRTAQSNPMAFGALNEGQTPPPCCSNMWKDTFEGLSLTPSRKEAELLSRLRGILCKFENFHPTDDSFTGA